MRRRREILAISQNPYIMVDYLGANGTQYIQTDYTPVENDEIDVKFYFDDNRTEALYSAGNGSYQSVAIISNGTLYVRNFSTNAANMGQIAKDAWRLLRIYYTGACILYSESGSILAQANTQYQGALDGDNVELRLFKRANNNQPFHGRISEFTITNNGATKLHLIPCVRKSDSKPGMYDTVSKTFYTNAGTGEFIVPA